MASAKSARGGPSTARRATPPERRARPLREQAKPAPLRASRAQEPDAAPLTDGGAAPQSKLVRDSFTIPKLEYAALNELKLRAARLGRPTKKSELLRAGVAALREMADARLLAALAVVPTLKPGRPKGGNGVAGDRSGKGKKRRRLSP
jgi:hypothetical protein